MSLDGLFAPLTIGSLTIPNRFAMAPMTRAASPDGIPGPDVAAYYARRAAGGVGLIITEGVRIPHPAAGYPLSIPTLADDALPGWRVVTEAVHDKGGRIAAQLWHQGALRHVDPADTAEQAPVSPSGVDGAGNPVGRALTTAGLDRLVSSYTLAARNARAAGFDAVELHGAHGYLLDQFFWDRTNLRTDVYGGSLRQRTRFPAEVVAAIRAEVGPDFPIIFRFSQWKSDHYDAVLASAPGELEELLDPLIDAGVTVLHPSTRRHYLPAFPHGSAPDSQRSLSWWTKKLTGVPVIAVGSVGLQTEFKPSAVMVQIAPGGVDRLAEGYSQGDFDIVAIGRALLADPTWVARLRSGDLSGFTGYDGAVALAGLH